MTLRRLSAAILIAASLALPAFAAEPVRRIAIHVEPYYAAADTADAPPRVNIGASFNTLLASTRREDILAAQDKIRAAPQLVTPMTLMVLAIRLYDVAARDDAVFWFYAAKDRFITLSDVADMRAAGLSGVESAIGAFATLAGPAINGYAFCDIANQQAIRATTLDWLEVQPLWRDHDGAAAGEARRPRRQPRPLDRGNQGERREGNGLFRRSEKRRQFRGNARQERDGCQVLLAVSGPTRSPPSPAAWAAPARCSLPSASWRSRRP